MTEKTKRIILIAAGVLLCAVLVVGIVSRLAAVPMPIDPAIPDDTPNTKDPVVNISDPKVTVDSKTDGERHDLGRDADSSGTEQAIQGTPAKPDAPEHPGKTEKDHAADDVGFQNLGLWIENVCVYFCTHFHLIFCHFRALTCPRLFSICFPRIFGIRLFPLFSSF